MLSGFRILKACCFLLVLLFKQMGEKIDMSTEVYYFSGTGNSLAVAKKIAQSMGCTLIPMALAENKETVKTDADKIVLVFPSYMAQLYGIPLIVERFIRKLTNINSKRLFAVCTCGGYELFNGLPTLRNLSRLVRSLKGRILAEYSVRLPMNTLDYSHIPVPINQNKESMFKRCDQKVLEISKAVVHNGKSRYQAAKVLLNWVMTPLYIMLQTVYYKELKRNAKVPASSVLGYGDLIQLADKSIYSDEKCKSCSTCAQVCPVGNIVMLAGKPTWQHHCEICLACAEWCPNKAIHHCSRPEGKSYHHPLVKLQDILEQANRQL
jgi:Pyruvate/2-oxoacid:ferredoxin oxidoreductase delta subunit/flavodoxin